MTLLRYFLSALILAMWPACTAAHGAPDGGNQFDDSVDLERDQLDGSPLGLKTFWYQGEESIDQVVQKGFESKFVAGTSVVLNHGYTSDNFWYRIRFYNPYDVTEKIYLHDPHNVYDEFEIYRGHSLIDAFHFKDTLHNRIVSIDLPAKETTSIYIRKKTNAVVHQTTFSFWRDYEKLRRAAQNSELRFQTVVTSLMMSVFLTLALIFAYRKKIYVFYLGYLLSFVGFATWVWSVYELPIYSRWGGVVSILCVLFTALFVDDFLDIQIHSPRMHKLFRVYAGLSLGVMILEWVNPAWRAYGGTLLSIAIQASTVWLGTSLFVRFRQPHILIFNFAFGSFLISGFVQLLIWMGVIDSAENYIMFYGVATENALMVLAIGYRAMGNETARKRTDDLLVHSFDQLSKVFYPHQILQIRNGKMVEETMPVGERNACILYFQIVGGTDLMNESYEDWVENFLVHCRQILMERYDPVRFCGDAYIIREVGDGFLCSIGYPFQQIGMLKSESAVELAEKLIAAFEAQLVSLDAAQNIHCSIGIVHGLVKSYFSRSGRIRDDLWGRVIAMASVYGAADRKLFEQLRRDPQNVVILHDVVYESLSSPRRLGYQILDYPIAQQILGRDLDGESIAYRIYGAGEYASTISQSPDSPEAGKSSQAE